MSTNNICLPYLMTLKQYFSDFLNKSIYFGAHLNCLDLLRQFK